MFENKKICTECGGLCCKTMPGACMPSDFGLPGNFDKLNQALESGKYCIDWWEGDPRENKEEYECGYFVRPATKDKVGIKHDPSWGGVCCLLNEFGCTLNIADRPFDCRNLEPKTGEGKNCINHGKPKVDAAIEWLPYYEKLKC